MRGENGEGVGGVCAVEKEGPCGGGEVKWTTFNSVSNEKTGKGTKHQRSWKSSVSRVGSLWRL